MRFWVASVALGCGLITAALALVRTQAEHQRVQLTQDVAPNAPPVFLDPHQMQQVFINLILNALQAMPQGGRLTIRASVKRLTDPGVGIGQRAEDVFQVGQTVLACEIEDTGIGIPNAILPNVFNPFFTTKPPGEGVGLGLSITSSIIQGHHGAIYIASQEGHGTTVSVYLPLPFAPGKGGMSHG